MGSDRSVVVLLAHAEGHHHRANGVLDGFRVCSPHAFRLPFFGDVAHEAAVIHDYLYKARWLSRRG